MDTREDIQRRVECNTIDQVLAELAAKLDPEGQALLERALRLTVSLYAAGIERSLAHARAAGADATLDDRLAGDDLLGKLLALHGLNPLTVAQRIAALLAKVRASLELADDDLAVISLTDGALQLRATPAIAGFEAQICSALEQAAPELGQIEITGSRPASVAA